MADGLFRRQFFIIIISMVLTFFVALPLSAEQIIDSTLAQESNTNESEVISVLSVFNNTESSDELRNSDLNPLNSLFQQITSIRDTLPTITVSPDRELVNRKREKAAEENPPLIGFGIDIPDLNKRESVKNNFLYLASSDGGTLLGMTIYAVNAVGMRVGLLIENIPDKVTVALFSPDTNKPVAPPVTGEEINSLIALNISSGDTSNEARTWWSPSVEGEKATILIHVPAGINISEIRFTIPKISYFFEEPYSNLRITRDAGACNNDATCESAWKNEATAVACMVFTKDGNSPKCTGTLLNDMDSSSFIPYFLSANHCISTQTVASTLETHWYYQSSSCNGYIRDSSYTKRTGGATLLYNNSSTDTSFMRLKTDPPSSVYYLGWTTSSLSSSGSYTCIHHPSADWKKISFGNLEGYSDCSSGYPCSSESSSTGKHINITWYNGITEGGSSGSALLNSSGQVVGQLLGGGSSCKYANEPDYYGRFDIAYNASLKNWLSSSSTPQPTTYSISGTVRAGSSTGSAIYGASVSLAGKTAATSSTGAFSISNIASGTYTITISKSGYQAYSKTLTVNSNLSNQTFTLTPMQLKYSVSGTVRAGSSTGSAIYGASVSLAGKTAATSSTGAFSISDIASGSYTIQILKSGYQTYSKPLPVNANISGQTFILTALAADSIPTLSIGGSALSGNINPATDIDWYKFTVTTSASYIIETFAGTLTDNYMYLYGPNNQTNLIEEDDDDSGGGDYMAMINRTLSVGTYYIKIQSYSSSYTGTYTITVKKISTDVSVNSLFAFY
ncbi:MAG: DVUA0089 family protein [Desulfamplus sp.]|nr:DVUA0089 family protein [Desulfamplus sp.]